jgi:DNA-binding MarR family transcriptional regulator
MSPTRQKCSKFDEQLIQSFFEEIPSAMGFIRQRMREHATPLLSVPEFRILAHLIRGPRTNSDLSELQGVDATTMSRLLDPLVKRGLVYRAENLKDRRRLSIELTDCGRELFLSIRKEISNQVVDRLQVLSNQEKQSLFKGLSILKKITTTSHETENESP